MKPLFTLMLDAHHQRYFQIDPTQLLSARKQCAPLAVRVLVYSPGKSTWHTDRLAQILIPQVLAQLGFVPRQITVQVTKHIVQG